MCYATHFAKTHFSSTTGQLTIACAPSHKRHRHENQNRWRYIAQFEYVHRAEESNIRPSSPSHASAADGRNCFLFCSQRCDICKQVGLGGAKNLIEIYLAFLVFLVRLRFSFLGVTWSVSTTYPNS